MVKNFVASVLALVGVRVFVELHPEADCDFVHEVGYDVMIDLGSYIQVGVVVHTLLPLSRRFDVVAYDVSRRGQSDVVHPSEF